MKQFKFGPSTLAVCTVAIFGLFVAGLAQGGEQGVVAERKIVTFKEGVSDSDRSGVLSGAGGHIVRHLNNGKLSVALLDRASEARLRSNARVLRVEDDAVAYALEANTRRITSKGRPSPPPPPSQVLPWGIDRIDAELLWGSSTTGSGVNVAVIDTGIELAHPDLAANIKGGYNAISPTKSANDDNGHGTHVAGTIGALNNTTGVVGAAPLVNLYAVKVLNKNGSGYYSDIIEGIDWAVANGADVINMSLGGSSDVVALHDAVIRAHSAGVVVVAAAGNSATAPVIYPAAYPEAIAVAATDSSDTIASFSSSGPEVDLAAPGVNVYSTYKGMTYKTLSGTSMATPHVTGAAALLLTVTEKCDTDLSGTCSPAEIQSRLELTATDLGDLGHDNKYGAGLLNAWAAITN